MTEEFMDNLKKKGNFTEYRYYWGLKELKRPKLLYRKIKTKKALRKTLIVALIAHLTGNIIISVMTFIIMMYLIYKLLQKEGRGEIGNKKLQRLYEISQEHSKR